MDGEGKALLQSRRPIDLPCLLSDLALHLGIGVS